MYKNLEKGRSMIEMLGVLAIIGVLSVGGIAGYSKAMEKWKINKTIEQIEQITHGIFTAYANQKEIDGIGGSNLMEILPNLGLITEDMWDEDALLLRFPVGNFDFIAATDGPAEGGNEEDVTYKYKYVEFISFAVSKDACLTLATANWSQFFPVRALLIGDSSKDEVGFPDECFVLGKFQTTSQGDMFGNHWLTVCNISEKDKSSPDYVPIPIPPKVAAEYCNCKKGDCYFGIMFSDF